MQWIQYILLGLVLLLLIRKFLPMKGLVNLTSQEVEDVLQKAKGYSFIDVREIHEYRGGHIKGFKNVPLSQLSNRIQELNPDQSIVLTCRSGMRSRQAAKILLKHGFTKVAHLKTGISGWHGGFVK
ncbi:rhodanese-like domain-containing protein [Fodinisporobacter ferrooxydans]|uniref:Rhodanese-like domain-containing protein n=1 Tax=Fodinisporobacter ferrooxydans TaxID=2901836 RepID=A0ABY4CRZ4_9BACL|nr:rhodanese-like domain-containing protein [Alicyclobacillaceae bacterium MYW30-H2]